MKAFCIMCGIRLKALFDNLRNLGRSMVDGTFQGKLESATQQVIMGKPGKGIEVVEDEE
jgi:hypothetical protein